MQIEKLNIRINLEESIQEVGQLIYNNGKIAFKYHPQFLKKGFNLSPIQLEFDNSIQIAKVNPFNGLHGIFSDSLPDAWGMLLLRKHLLNKNIALESTNPLTQLAFSANKLGALEYYPEINSNECINSIIELDTLQEKANKLIEGEELNFESYFNAQGSPGGARPKIYIQFDPVKNELVAPLNASVTNEEWIVKFNAKSDYPDMAYIEFAYYKMATQAGLRMSNSALFKGQSGKEYFGTKRFDVSKSGKLHMISAAALFHDDYQHSQMDYGTLMQEGMRLTSNRQVVSEIFRLAAFNVFAHNRDDHSKNFAFLSDKGGNWKFAPAYDLTFSFSSHGHHSTFVAGNSINPGQKELLELANHFSLKNGKEIIEEVREAIAQWSSISKDNGVTKKTSKLIQEYLNKI